MTSMIDYSADIQISECMNDIINQVETREWNRVNEHRDRLVKKMKKQNEKIQYWKNTTGEAEDKLDEQMKVNEDMSENWEVATEKIGQENCDLHNEIKRLKNEMKLLKDVNKSHLQRLEHMEKSKSGIRYKKLSDENEKLKEFKSDVIDALQFDQDSDDAYIILSIREMEEQYDINKDESDSDEIERLRELIEKYENRWKMFNVERELEITLLTAEYGSEEIRNCMKENEKYKSSLMNSSGSFKCEKCNIHLTEDDVYRSVDECEGKLLCESCWED